MLWYGSSALCACVILKLIRERLIGRAPFTAFGVMQGTMLGRDLLLASVPLYSMKYTWIWEATLPAIFITQAVSGVACYRAITRLYPQIGSFATKLFAVAILVTALISLSGLPHELAQLRTAPVFLSLLICYRLVDTLLAGGLVLAVAFLAYFPSPLRKLPSNIIRHTVLLAAYFSVYAIANLMPLAQQRLIDEIRMAVICALYLAWAVGLSAAGEVAEAWPALDEAKRHLVNNRREGGFRTRAHAARSGRK